MKKLLTGISLSLLLISATIAKADTQGINFTSINPGDTFNNSFGYSLGYSFTVSSTITVDDLGYFDDGSLSSLTESHEVGLYNSGGTLLASTDVTSSSGSQVGFFDYNSISAVTLIAGDTYEVVGVSGVVDPYTFTPVGFSTDPSITFGNSVYDVSNTLAYATTNGGVTGFFGPDFELASATATTVTPEPSSLTLLGTGLASAIGLIRRRLKA